MSFEHISHLEPVARKEYTCVWCGRMIAINEKHVHRAYRFDGGFHRDRMHQECYSAMLRSDDLGDGFPEFEFMRGKSAEETEDFRDKQHPELEDA